MIGAMATVTSVPLGILTGRAPANNVMTVQKIRPAIASASRDTPSGTDISGLIPKTRSGLCANTKLVRTSANALTLTSPAM
jgi:hypothetical protein